MKKIFSVFLAVGIFLISSLTTFAYERKDYPDFMNSEKDLSKISLNINGFGLYDESWDKEQTMYKSNQGIIMTPVKTFTSYLGGELITLSDKEFKTKYNGKEYQFIVGSSTVKKDGKLHKLETPITDEKGVIAVPFWDLVEIWDLAAKIENDSNILDRYVDPTVAVVSVWSQGENTVMINMSDERAKEIVSNANEWLSNTEKLYKKVEKGFSKYYIDRIFVDTRDIYSFYVYDDSGYITDIATSNENVDSEYMVFIKNGKIIGEAFYQNPSEAYKSFNFWYVDPAEKKEYPTMINPEEIKKCQNVGFYSNGLNVMTIIPNPFYEEGGE